MAAAGVLFGKHRGSCQKPTGLMPNPCGMGGMEVKRVLLIEKRDRESQKVETSEIVKLTYDTFFFIFEILNLEERFHSIPEPTILGRKHIIPPESVPKDITHSIRGPTERKNNHPKISSHRIYVWYIYLYLP